MSNNDIHSKMLDYIIGNLSDDEKLALDLIIKENIELKQEFESLKTIWEQSQNISFPVFDEQKALNNIWKKAENKTITLGRNFKIIWKIAAVLVIGIFASYYFIINRNTTIQYVEIIANKGEKVTVNLPDGNKVWLNSNSSIKYPADFTTINKRMEVNGEAYFEIKNNKNPIMILVGSTIINCDSACFNLKNKINNNNEIEIVVEKGNISIFSMQMEDYYVVNSGEKATISALLPLAVANESTPNASAWKTGELIFNQSSLKTVADVLTDYYGISVIIKGNIKYCDFTSSYKNKDLTEILTDIKRIYNTQIIQKANEIIIQGNNCL